MHWTRTKQWAAVGILVVTAATAVVTAGTAGAHGDGRWPASFPASFWTGARWQHATAQERRSYVLGIIDGLRLAAVLNRAQVNLDDPVLQCLQRMSADYLTSRVGGHLDGIPIEVDEPTLHFHVWDGLVAACLDPARLRG
jgi:hypothetical protein